MPIDRTEFDLSKSFKKRKFAHTQKNTVWQPK